MDRRTIPNNEWQAALDNTVVRKEDMNKLVMDFLVTEGYLDAARTFEEESGTTANIDLQLVEDRNKLRQAIQEGNVASAITMIGSKDPEVLDEAGDLIFYLRQQQTIELILEDKIEEALDYAEAHLTPLGRDRPELKAEIEKTIALLALKDFPENPISYLGTGEQRYLVATKVNQAMLKYQNQSLESRLPRLLRMIAWAEKELDKHCRFPHLRDLAF